MGVTNHQGHVRQVASAGLASDVAMASAWRTSQNLSVMEMTTVEMEQVNNATVNKINGRLG